MLVDVQGAVKAGNLSSFEWVNIKGVLVRRPAMTSEIKNILRAHGLHQPHVATVPRPIPDFLGDESKKVGVDPKKFDDDLETCAKCGRKCKLDQCAPAAAAASSSSSSDGSSTAQGSASGGDGSSSTANGSSSAGSSAV